MKTTFTDEQVKAAVEQAISERGEDYVYPNAGGVCYNVMYNPETGQVEPSCIVGHAIVNLGYDPERLVPVEESGVDETLTELEIRVSPWAQQMLTVMQNSQDFGQEWGIAYARGREAAVG